MKEEFRDNQLFIATDGGACENKGNGSIGFLLTNSNGHPFIKSYGQPSGYEPKSYRSEICATLAALRLLRLYIEYYDTILGNNILSEKINVHIYTDSESMMIKLKKMNEYPTAKHRMTLHPEWDVLYALHQTLESFPKRPTIEWVESHQDDHKANRNLSFGAKLNIQADKLATIGLQALKCKPRVPMAPSSCVQIHMNGTTITREFRKEVRLRVHKKKLSEYYCARFRWSNRLITRIDWSIFGPAYIRRTKKKFVWTHKFHNRKLPTGKRMKKRGGLEDERCCSCGVLLETDDHLF